MPPPCDASLCSIYNACLVSHTPEYCSNQSLCVGNLATVCANVSSTTTVPATTSTVSTESIYSTASSTASATSSTDSITTTTTSATTTTTTSETTSATATVSLISGDERIKGSFGILLAMLMLA